MEEYLYITSMVMTPGREPNAGGSRAGAPQARAEAADARRLVDGIQWLVRRFALSERADIACCGVTVAQAATLGALRTEGSLRQTELGRRLGITASTLTRNLDRLVEGGLVERRADPGDGRAARVVLTRAGAAAAREVERQEAAFARSILQRLPEERRGDVLASVALLIDAVREATGRCCPGAFDHLMGEWPRATARRGDDDDAACCK